MNVTRKSGPPSESILSDLEPGTWIECGPGIGLIVTLSAMFYSSKGYVPVYYPHLNQVWLLNKTRTCIVLDPSELEITL